MSRIRGFLTELKRRHVYHVGAAYVTIGLLVLGASELILDPLGLGSARPLIVVLTLVGFPIALVLAWAYDLRRAGDDRTDAPAHRDDRVGRSAPGSPTMGPGDDRKSIVVLPFDNMSPDPADAYFADGLTEELIADLSGVHALRVISRTSAMSFKDSRLDLRAIAGQLKVRYVLEGSVRRAGDTLRVTAQLIDADADSHLWAEKYSGKLEDVFDLQEQLSRQIVSVLRLRLSPAEESQLLARPIPDVRAYEHYLRARANIYSFDAPSIERAIRDLRAALDLLGDNALFLRALGMAHFQEMNAGLTEDPAVIDRIEECGRRIAAVRQDDAGAFLLLGLAHWMRGDCRSAVVSLRNGYRRDHTDPDIMLFLAVMSLSTGQVDLAGDLVRELHRVDPLAPLSPLLVGFHHLFEGRFAQAADFLDRAVELGPEVIVVRCLAVRVFIAAGKHDRAVESARFLRDRVPGSAFSESADLFVRGLTAKGGDVPRPSPTLQTYVERDCEMAQYLSDAYAFAGDPKKALSTLEMAFRTGFMNDAYLTRHDPFISSVRDSPEWKALLIRMLQGRREFEAALPSLP